MGSLVLGHLNDLLFPGPMSCWERSMSSGFTFFPNTGSGQQAILMMLVFQPIVPTSIVGKRVIRGYVSKFRDSQHVFRLSLLPTQMNSRLPPTELGQVNQLRGNARISDVIRARFNAWKPDKPGAPAASTPPTLRPTLQACFRICLFQVQCMCTGENRFGQGPFVF